MYLKLKKFYFIRIRVKQKSFNFQNYQICINLLILNNKSFKQIKTIESPVLVSILNPFVRTD